MSSLLDRLRQPELKRFHQISTMITGHVILIAVMSVVNLDAHFKKTGEVRFDILQWQALFVALICAVYAYWSLAKVGSVKIASNTTASDGENMLLRVGFIVLSFELLALIWQPFSEDFAPNGEFEPWRCLTVLAVLVLSQWFWRMGRKATPF